ncbi:APC family permease [Francisella adeliensis]|uniref:Amino acid permease n=1 Tax=Francisella adeliensis TaxID=2007306 RepID=A0A2Z4XZI2_9GAMM|nr:APC family permease [Francisella adeliensis]AXA34170.1 hypothetical protein CDH04_07035 [Francisella adeliensis]MBK2085521.1 hypothetical protein [Francisella adeliensis]MBK2096357.1 hypothetical protein [Francisella adeliensis]QIW12414.1 hypothetical protein FZC43_07035 [Francisella adeliensis]QIW14288.1 hypothetical protein FZC44_07035 [Francisella adeliensis]
MQSNYQVSISKFVFIMVGMVISGQYFGWNSGITASSTNSYILAVLLLVVFFGFFIFGCAILTHYFMGSDKSITELVGNVLGIRTGIFTGLMCYLEYWFATPAIAIAFGLYLESLLPFIPYHFAVLIGFIIVFMANLGSLKYVAKIESIATIIAILGVFCFYYIGFEYLGVIDNSIVQDSISMSALGKGIAFGVWLFLGIEGGITLMHAMKNPRKTGKIAILIGLMVLSLLAIFTSVLFIELAPTNLLLDSNPLPALAQYLGHSALFEVLAVTGIIAILASFNGLTIGYSQQYELLANNYRFKNTKFYAMNLPLLVALICSLSNDLSQGFVILSVSSAIVVYALVWVSVIKLTYSLKRYVICASYTLALPLLLVVGGCTYYYGALTTSITIFDIKVLAAYLLVVLIVIAMFIACFIYRKKS